MGDFTAALNGKSGAFSWQAALGLALFIILVMILAAKVPALRKLTA